jgi:hypothetical protein
VEYQAVPLGTNALAYFPTVNGEENGFVKFTLVVNLKSFFIMTDD